MIKIDSYKVKVETSSTSKVAEIKGVLDTYSIEEDRFPELFRNFKAN